MHKNSYKRLFIMDACKAYARLCAEKEDVELGILSYPPVDDRIAPCNTALNAASLLHNM